MADEKVKNKKRAEEDEAEPTEAESNGGATNGNNVGRFAAIAAASGATAATALAARKALNSRSSSNGDDKERGPRRKKSSSAESGASLVGTALASGWDVAKDSLLPVIENAATKAGAYVAESAPEVVRDVVVPRFISGFEDSRGRESGSDESDD